MIFAIDRWVLQQPINRIAGFIMVSIIGLALYQANNHFHLYADGSRFFINILPQHTTFNPLQSRFSANTIQPMNNVSLPGRSRLWASHHTLSMIPKSNH